MDAGAAGEVRFAPRLAWAWRWSVLFALFVPLSVVEWASGGPDRASGEGGAVVFAVTTVVILAGLTAMVLAERTRPISLDQDGFSILGLPAIPWSAVRSIRIEIRTSTTGAFRSLVITVNDPAALAAARVGHGAPFSTWGSLDGGPSGAGPSSCG